jgi:predicted nucleic acid-binding protein
VISNVLLDTGPLVAYLHGRDRHHAWGVQQLSQIAPPLLTCEAVLAEACFLLQSFKGGGRLVLELLESGLVRLAFRLEEEISAVRKLVIRYQSVPMALADACLVRMSELRSQSSVLTCDGDFRIYRKHGRMMIPLIIP